MSRSECRVPEPNGIDCSSRASRLVPGKILPPLVTHVLVRMELGGNEELTRKWVWSVASEHDQARVTVWIALYAPALMSQNDDAETAFARLLDREIRAHG